LNGGLIRRNATTYTQNNKEIYRQTSMCRMVFEHRTVDLERVKKCYVLRCPATVIGLEMGAS
jgi:hypothetical protein